MPKRILVVDDDERVLFVLHVILAGLGSQYEVVTAQSGYEALDKAREMPFDLLIADLRMPGMDGVEPTEAVRTLSPSTVVIWITAYDSQETNAEAQRPGGLSLPGQAAGSCRDPADRTEGAGGRWAPNESR